MKFCQLLTYPEAHLRNLRAAQPGLADATFKAQSAALAADAPDATVLWAPTLAGAGHDAHFIVANDSISQHRWTAEKLADFTPPEGDMPAQQIVIEQLRKLKVDVLCIGDPLSFDARFIRRLKKRPRWIVGCATRLADSQADWSGFDLMLSPHEACVRQAWKFGAGDARLFRPGFPRPVAEAVFQEPKTLDVVYCGSWVPGEAEHHQRITTLAQAAARHDRPLRLGLHLGVFEGAALPPLVRELNQGPRFGLERYRVLTSAKITVVEEPAAALGPSLPPGVFEGTGVGTCTLMEENGKLSEFFKPGGEVVTYRGPAELVAKLDELLAAEERRNTIAIAGQERCLTSHSMEARMEVLVSMLEGKPGGLPATMRRWRHRWFA